MRRITTFKSWAPDSSIWTPWAKPVLFSSVPRVRPLEAELMAKLNQLPLERAAFTAKRTAVIIDLPGSDGVVEAMALARQGYRPVPLYNGVYGPNQKAMIIDVTELVGALFAFADELNQAGIVHEAPPVFMLDANRMDGLSKQVGKFDNRWCIFPQDMPSAAFLLENGVERVVVFTDWIKNDLAHILQRYDEKGIALFQTKDGTTLLPRKGIKASGFKGFLYRFKLISGLTRNYAGGFGGVVPEPTQSRHSGGRYYGYG